MSELRTYLLLVPLLLQGLACASAEMAVTQSHRGGELPAPTEVFVYDVQLTTPNPPSDGEPRARDEKVARGLTEETVSRIQREGFGIPVNRLARGAPLPVGALGLDLELSRIDKGSMFQRVLVGFGLGKSELQGGGTILLNSAQTGEETVESVGLVAHSGSRPGLVLLPVAAILQGWVVATAITGTAAVLGEVSSTVAQDTRRSAKAIHEHLQELFARQNWPRLSPQPGD